MANTRRSRNKNQNEHKEEEVVTTEAVEAVETVEVTEEAPVEAEAEAPVEEPATSPAEPVEEAAPVKEEKTPTLTEIVQTMAAAFLGEKIPANVRVNSVVLGEYLEHFRPGKIPTPAVAGQLHRRMYNFLTAALLNAADPQEAAKLNAFFKEYVGTHLESHFRPELVFRYVSNAGLSPAQNKLYIYVMTAVTTALREKSTQGIDMNLIQHNFGDNEVVRNNLTKLIQLCAK